MDIGDKVVKSKFQRVILPFQLSTLLQRKRESSELYGNCIEVMSRHNVVWRKFPLKKKMTGNATTAVFSFGSRFKGGSC